MAEADCVLFAAILTRSLSYPHATRDWYQVNLAHIPDEGIPLMPWSFLQGIFPPYMSKSEVVLFENLHFLRK